MTLTETEAAEFRQRCIDFLEQLPRMDNGKLYKRHLQDAYREAG